MERTPKGPATVGRILDDAWRLYVASFGKVWYLAGLASLVISVPVSCARYAVSNGDLAVGAFFVVSLASLAICLFFVGVVFARMGAVADGDELPVFAAFRRGFGSSVYLFVATVLYVLALYLGLILILIPGIAISVFFILYPVLVVRERMDPFSALGESWGRVWRRWWRTLLVVSVGGFLWAVGYVTVAAGVLPVVRPAFDLAAYLAPTPDWLVATAIIETVAATLFSPILYAVLIVQSDELAMRWRGRDLAHRVSGLGR